MASRLSSLLVHDGVVSVKQMEEAFQRQVIYGGALDTILLEMNVIGEAQLTSYLAQAAGLPPATPALLGAADPEAHKACPLNVVEAYHAVPVSFDGDALRLLVSDPVDIARLEALATRLQRPVQPYVTPEFRHHEAMQRAFLVPLPARFERLLAKLGNVTAHAAAPSRDEKHVTMKGYRVPTSPPPSTGVPVPVAEADTAKIPPVSAETNVGGEAGDAFFVALPGALGVDLAAEERLANAIDAQLEEMAARLPGGDVEVVVDEGSGRAALPDGASSFTTTETGTLKAADYADRVEQGEANAPVMEITGEMSGESEASGEINVQPRAPHLAVPEPTVVVPSGPVQIESGAPGSAAPAVQTGRSAWRHREGADASAMLVADALDGLSSAQERDDIFELVARAIRSRLEYVAVLTVQQGAAQGRLAIEGDAFEVARVATVVVPLDSPSAFRTAHETAAPYVGPLAAVEDRVVDAVTQLGGEVPQMLLLLPIVLRDRVIALLYGYCRARPLPIDEIADLLVLGPAAGQALGRLILKVKSQGYARSSAASSAVPMAEIPSSKSLENQLPARAEPGVWQAAKPSPKVPRGEWPPMQAVSGPIISAPYSSGARRDQVSQFGKPIVGAAPGAHVTSDVFTRAQPRQPAQRPETADIDRALDRIEDASDPRAAQAAIHRLGDMPDDLMLPRAMKRFPGRLNVDRYSMHGRMLRASQHGPLLAFLVSLGERATPWIVGRLVDPDREIRYYATVACVELATPAAAQALAARLFDPDYAIRAAAVEALANLPGEARDGALEPVRKAAADVRDPVRARSAVQSLGELRDLLAMPALLAAVGARDSTLAEASRRALVELTKQDFGTSQRKWEAWWEKNQDRHRIEWMLEGLAHKSDEVRMSASEELKRVTGEVFGYHYDLPRREREEARLKWVGWWEQTGKRRFVRHT